MFDKKALTAIGLAIVAGTLATATQPAEAYWNKNFSRAHNNCINDGGTWRHGDCFFGHRISHTYRTSHNGYPTTTTTRYHSYYDYYPSTTRYRTYTYPSYSSYYYSYPTYRGSNGYWYNGVWYPM